MWKMAKNIHLLYQKHLFTYTFIQSAKHVAAAQCTEKLQIQLLCVRKCSYQASEGERKCHLMAQKQMISWDCHSQLSVECTEDVAKKKQTKLSEQMFCRWNNLVNQRCQKRIVQADRMATATLITTLLITVVSRNPCGNQKHITHSDG